MKRASHRAFAVSGCLIQNSPGSVLTEIKESTQVTLAITYDKDLLVEGVECQIIPRVGHVAAMPYQQPVGFKKMINLQFKERFGLVCPRRQEVALIAVRRDCGFSRHSFSVMPQDATGVAGMNELYNSAHSRAKDVF